MAHPLSLFFSSSLSTSRFPPKGSFSCLFITSSSFPHLAEFHFNLFPIRQQRSFLIPAREPTRKHNNDNYNNHNQNHRDLKYFQQTRAMHTITDLTSRLLQLGTLRLILITALIGLLLPSRGDNQHLAALALVFVHHPVQKHQKHSRLASGMRSLGSVVGKREREPSVPS